MKFRDETDRAFSRLGVRAVQLLDAQPGARIIDVGCGAGSTVLEIAEAVGAEGHVLGVDVCRDLLQCAGERTSHLPQVDLCCGDAATKVFAPQFDAGFSRFGTMFFADPVQAFTNMRSALRPDGRIVLTAWQDAEKNGWCADLMRVVLPLVDELPEPYKPRAPGTFAFAEREYLEQILAESGFRKVNIEDVREPVPMGSGSVQAAVEFALRVGPAASLTEKQTESVRRDIRAALADFFAAAADGEHVALPGAAWLVTAQA